MPNIMTDITNPLSIRSATQRAPLRTRTSVYAYAHGISMTPYFLCFVCVPCEKTPTLSPSNSIYQ